MGKKQITEGMYLAKVIDNWFTKEEGLSCSEGMTSGEYLKNRLQLAFVAGWYAHESYIKKVGK